MGHELDVAWVVIDVVGVELDGTGYGKVVGDAAFVTLRSPRRAGSVTKESCTR